MLKIIPQSKFIIPNLNKNISAIPNPKPITLFQIANPLYQPTCLFDIKKYWRTLNIAIEINIQIPISINKYNFEEIWVFMEKIKIR